MVLTDEQCGRFFDTMDSLLYYVNERFQVVEGFTLDYEGQLGDMKAALVTRALWDNVEIIDEFVRENPARLPQKCLDLALSWRSALPGVYTVVRYQGGNAILMNDVGVFSVQGVTLELEGEIGKAPAYADMVLLPFDDVIIYDGFLQAYDCDGTVDETTRIQDEFENRCARGIVSTASEFVRVANAHLAAERDKELDALLADVAREAEGADEVLPAGYHRGPLAGLDTIEREAAIAAEMARRHPSDGSDERREHAPEPARNHDDLLVEQALNCAIASVIARGLVEIGEAYEQYCAVAPDALTREEFDFLVRAESTYSDAYFGLWQHDGRDYLQYYTLTPDYITQQAARGGTFAGLRDELDYYESFRASLLEARAEVSPKPLSRTLLENTALGELLRDDNVARLRRFFDERIPDGQDDYTFADLAAQEFALTAIESGGLEGLRWLADELGVSGCATDDARLIRLATNVFNAMPSWENNGWSPQELYEQLTGRRMFYNEDGTVKKVGRDDPCPCGSGEKYRDCCGR